MYYNNSIFKEILQQLTYFSTEVICIELSRTINSDKRYYLDKKTIENAGPGIECCHHISVEDDKVVFLFLYIVD